VGTRETRRGISAPPVTDTHLTQFSARKIIFRPLACAAQEAICALQKRLIEVVVADQGVRRSAEMRTNSDLDPANLNLTIN
jgi:hypothetical protein